MGGPCFRGIELRVECDLPEDQRTILQELVKDFNDQVRLWSKYGLMRNLALKTDGRFDVGKLGNINTRKDAVREIDQRPPTSMEISS